jgi:uncharacterized short protein YbdD (DUF466 family)
MRMLRQVRRWAKRFWRGLREWCGDSAYERYVRWTIARPSSCDALLSAKQFYVEQLNRKYSRPNRCC